VALGGIARLLGVPDDLSGLLKQEASQFNPLIINQLQQP
jgi:hypothetical protein